MPITPTTLPAKAECDRDPHRRRSSQKRYLAETMMATAQNKKNIKTGQQDTNEPWKEPDEDDNGRPKSPPNVVEQEVKKKKGAVPSQK
jgi:hypothetical protein